MRNHSLFMLFLILIVTFFMIGNSAFAQEPADPSVSVLNHLPDGVNLMSASVAELADAVEKAAAKNPEKVADIVREISSMRPDAVAAIVNAALRAVPDALDEVCFAAKDGAPKQAMGVDPCMDLYRKALRMESEAPSKPVRDEPSPVKPR